MTAKALRDFIGKIKVNFQEFFVSEIVITDKKSSNYLLALGTK